MIEIPAPRLVVTEHHAVQKACPVCQTVTAGECPAAVTQPVQYGPRTKAVAVYWQSYQLLSAARERQKAFTANRLTRRLEKLGYRVTITPPATPVAV